MKYITLNNDNNVKYGIYKSKYITHNHTNISYHEPNSNTYCYERKQTQPRTETLDLNTLTWIKNN